MSPTRTSLGRFLATARKALTTPASQQPKPLTFVVGNESADLDSLCSALLLAYFRSHAPPHYTLHIPVANLLRADLGLRTELDAVLKYTDVKANDVVTLSDLPAELKPENTRWVLADHNALTGDLGRQFSGSIVGCVDHHADEGKVPADCVDEPRVIRKCGSCMTLVVEHCRDVWKELASKQGNADWDAALARVALAPILVDTANLKSKDKTTEADVQMVELAESHIRDADYDRKGYFDDISRVKEHISHLSYRDILRKDYKQWHDGGLTLGISSVVQGFDYLLEKIGDQDKLLEALRSSAIEQKLDIAAIMTAKHDDGKLTRELLVWGLNQEAAKVLQNFAERNSDELGLESWGNGRLDDAQEGSSEWRKCWRQHRIEHSRKQVAPMLREVMAGSSKL